MPKIIKPPFPIVSAAPPPNESIFPASRLTPLAIRWKELSAAGKHKEAMFILEDIIVGSTAMFERLAQFEDFHYTVDLPILVSAAQERVVKWLQKWNIKKGKLFSWFGTCAKNSFRSELFKVNQYRKRNYVTSDNLEKFYGVEDHDIDKRDLAKEFNLKLKQMTCRWGDPQEIMAIRYLLDCVIDDERDKQCAIRGAAYACGISMDLSKLFYTWVVGALRDELYEKVYIPYTAEDLFRAHNSYSPLVELLEYMSWDKLKRLMVRWQGQRIKFPTIATMLKQHENYLIFQEIHRSDLDPDAVKDIARKNGRTSRAAQEIYYDMIDTLNPKRTGEYEIYADYDNRDSD